MAIRIKLKENNNFLKSLQDHAQNNGIRNWVMDEDGDLTLQLPEWNCRAWMRMRQDKENPCDITFGIVASKQHPMTKLLYANYHSKLAEMLLVYYDTEIETLSISPLLVRGKDVFQE